MWERVIEVVQEMMTDRCFTTRKSPMENILIYEDTQGKQIMIFMCKTEKFNIENVKYFIYLLQQYSMKHGIIIYNNIITSSAKKALDHLMDYTIEIFEKKELQYNVTRHRLFCPHIRIPREEIDKEIAPVHVQQFPVLLRNDMISRYYHFTRGDIIRIHRKNGSIVYRIVK
jgi:DNA-directed RNA polymerase subunit H (RpoH/RPB5)